jgi:hypothetical protein
MLTFFFVVLGLVLDFLAGLTASRFYNRNGVAWAVLAFFVSALLVLLSIAVAAFA